MRAAPRLGPFSGGVRIAERMSRSGGSGGRPMKTATAAQPSAAELLGRCDQPLGRAPQGQLLADEGVRPQRQRGALLLVGQQLLDQLGDRLGPGGEEVLARDQRLVVPRPLAQHCGAAVDRLQHPHPLEVGALAPVKVEQQARSRQQLELVGARPRSCSSCRCWAGSCRPAPGDSGGAPARGRRRRAAARARRWPRPGRRRRWSRRPLRSKWSHSGVYPSRRCSARMPCSRSSSAPRGLMSKTAPQRVAIRAASRTSWCRAARCRRTPCAAGPRSEFRRGPAMIACSCGAIRT